MLELSRRAEWSFPSSSGNPLSASPQPHMKQLSAKREDFASAARYLATHGDVGAATELAANIWRLWVVTREEAAGRAFLASILDRPDAPSSRRSALALYGDGLLAFRLGDLASSRARNEAALAIARKVGDREAEGLASLGLSRVELSEKRHDRARVLAAESRALLQDLGPAFGQSPLHMLAQATRFTGPDDEAARLFEASLELNRRLSDRNMVRVELHNLGHVELRRGRVDVAERHFAECAQMSAGIFDPYDAAMIRFNHAAVAFARGDRERTVELLREVREIVVEAKLELASDDQQELEELTRRVDEAR